MKSMVRILLGISAAFFLLPLKMQAGTEQITQADFECYLRYECSSSSLKENWEGFVIRKLKAADAEFRGWDTLPSFIQLCKKLQAEALKSFLQPNAAVTAAEYKTLQRCYRLEQWLYPLSPRASQKEERAAVSYMDSVYRNLGQNGGQGSFSGCRHFVKWYTQESSLKEFWQSVSALSVGEVSAPFLSPLGVHVVRLLAVDSRPLLGEASCMEEAGKLWPDAEVCWNYAEDNGTQIGLQGIRDSLLAICWDHFTALALQEKDISAEELDSYFHQNRQCYEWEFPHFKGAIVYCESKKVASRFKKYLKKYDFYMWKDALARFREEHPGLQVKMEAGVFQIGKNPYVDKLAFKCGSLPTDAGETYVFAFGKRLKKGPESFMDVYAEVLQDYRKYLYNLQIQELRRRFRLEFDAEVLKTVNCCGSN